MMRLTRQILLCASGLLLLGATASGCCRRAHHMSKGFVKDLSDGSEGWVEALGEDRQFRMLRGEQFPHADVLVRSGWVYLTGDVTTARTDLVVAHAAPGRMIIQRRPASVNPQRPAHDRVIFLSTGPNQEGRVWAYKRDIAPTDPGRPVPPGTFIDAWREAGTVRFSAAQAFDDHELAKLVRDQRVKHEVP